MTHDPARPDSSHTPIDWEALARYLAGESPASERERIEQYLAAHPGDADVISALDNAVRALALGDASEIDVESALKNVSARLGAPETDVVPLSTRGRDRWDARRTIARPWRIASILTAAAVVVFAARAVLQRSSGSRPQGTIAAGRTFATAVGKRDSIRLPDGSRVVLGPASRLTIAQGYGNREREVELHGEGYFDVVHDSIRPFTVRVALATIRDVGTTFVVRQDGARVRVVVTSGSVLIRPDSTAASQHILRAGDVGTLGLDGQVSIARDVPTSPYLSWMQGSLDYRDATLSEVSGDLRRWYGVVLRVDDSSLARRHLKATFNGDPVDRILKVIALDLGADLVIRGDTAVLTPRRAQ